MKFEDSDQMVEFWTQRHHVPVAGIASDICTARRGLVDALSQSQVSRSLVASEASKSTPNCTRWAAVRRWKLGAAPLALPLHPVAGCARLPMPRCNRASRSEPISCPLVDTQRRCVLLEQSEWRRSASYLALVGCGGVVEQRVAPLPGPALTRVKCWYECRGRL